MNRDNRAALMLTGLLSATVVACTVLLTGLPPSEPERPRVVVVYVCAPLPKDEARAIQGKPVHVELYRAADVPPAVQAKETRKRKRR